MRTRLLFVITLASASYAVTVSDTLCGGTTATLTMNYYSPTGAQVGPTGQPISYTGGTFSVSLNPTTLVSNYGGYYRATVKCGTATATTTKWLIPETAATLTIAKVQVDTYVAVENGWYWDPSNLVWASIGAGISGGGGGGIATVNGENGPAITIAPGTNVTVNTTPGSDTVTINAAGGGGGTMAVNPQTGTTYTILAADTAPKLVTVSNAAGVAVTVPQAGTAGFEANKYFLIENIGAGDATITPTTSTINGLSSLILPTNTGGQLVSDGTNWRAFLGPLRATSAEITAGTNNTKFITPAGGIQQIQENCALPAIGGNPNGYVMTIVGGNADWAAATGSGGGLSVQWVAAKSQNTVGGSNGSWGETGASSPVPKSYCPGGACTGGTTTNVSYGVLAFDDTGTRTVGDHFDLPSSVPTFNADFSIQTDGTNTGAVTFRLYTACVGAGESMDVTWNSAQSVNFTPTGTARRVLIGTVSGVTTTGCTGSEKLMWKTDRDTTDANPNGAELIAIHFHQ